MTPYQGETYRRIKHALGLKHMHEGDNTEARRCFEAVLKDAKKEARAK